MGKPRLILIIRHGESEANIDKSVNEQVPNHLVQLTKRGHEQAKASGERLLQMLEPTDKVAIFTSPYTRTMQTTDGMCKALKEHSVPYWIHEEPRMREQDFGNFQGGPEEMNRIWTTRARYGHFFFRIPNGESAADVYDRCAGFNETLYRQFESDSFPSVLVLVSHGIWSRVFLMKWFGWSYTKFETFKNIPHCQFLIMQRELQPNGRHKYKLRTKLATWDTSRRDNEEDETDSGGEGSDLPDSIGSVSKEELIRMREKERKIMEFYHSARNSAAASQESVSANSSRAPSRNPSRSSSPSPHKMSDSK